MNRLAFISLGSNILPEEHLPQALEKLWYLGEVAATSTMYQNPAVGPRPEPDYLNAAALLRTEMDPFVLQKRLRETEEQLGRIRTADRFAPRTIDLDLCLYGYLVLCTPLLTLPDPGILKWAHLAVPLAELAPDFRHPVSGESLSAIASRLRLDSRLTARKDLPGFQRSATETQQQTP